MKKAIFDFSDKKGLNRIPLNAGLFFFVLLSSCVQEKKQPEWQKTYTDPATIRQLFANPPLFYAPHTFWFWDDTLRPEKIAAMAAEMCRQRLNPGYAHGRGEENEPYPLLPKEEWLSDKWFASFAGALHQAEKHHMTLGYCDEYWWPSGQAAGRVLKQHPELEAKYLAWKRYEIRGNEKVHYENVDFAVAARLQHNKLISSSLQVIGEKSPIEWTAPEGKWVVYTYSIQHHAGFDGGKVNYLDPRLAKVFIPLVHEQYARHFGKKLGYSIPGCFVDNEGDFGWQMAWSDSLASHYRKTYQRDIRLWLPLLTEKDAEGLYVKARCNWYEAVTDMYIKSFFEPVVSWLAGHGMYYISNLWEESIQWQTQAMGDFMKVTRVATMPGTDCLEMRSQDVHDFKETQSVAEFENRPFMSEIMGVAGWEQTPAMMKKTINAITAYGVNHVVPHGINVNRRLETIPYPADWFTENPYWNHLHLWTDFARRAAFITRQSSLVADVLIVNPLETAFALSENYFSDEHTTSWDPFVDEANGVYSATMRILFRNHIDFLIADKHYLMMSNIVKKTERCLISIKQHDFQAIILPPLFVISQEAARKIVNFARQGGMVVSLGRLPKASPEKGDNDTTVMNLMNILAHCPSFVSVNHSSLQTLIDVLQQKIHPAVTIENKQALLYTASRKSGPLLFYWMANNSDTAVNTSILLRDGKGRLEKWDCETGSINEIPYEQTPAGAKTQISLHPYEAFWLVCNTHQPAGPASSSPVHPQTPAERIITGKWIIKPLCDTFYVSSARAFFSRDRELQECRLTEPFSTDEKWQYASFVYSRKTRYAWTTPMVVFRETQKSKFFRYAFILKEKPVRAVINVCGDDDEKIWINGQQIPGGKNTAAYNKTYAYDITPYVQKGNNVIGIEIINNGGLGTLMAEGWYELPDGKIELLGMNPAWKESFKAAEGWNATAFNDKGWKRVTLASDELCRERRELSEGPVEMKYPKDLKKENQFIYFRLQPPAGTTKMIYEKNLSNALVYFDGKKQILSPEKNEITIPATLKEIAFAWPYDGEPYRLQQPIAFTAVSPVEKEPGSWYDDGYLQYTGYVLYEKKIVLNSKPAKTFLDLGKVKYMAEVWVNGKKAGERLWEPFVFDVSAYIRQGENLLSIKVGNLMVNRMWLYHDLGQLRTWGWKGTPHFEQYDAGLWGPVKLITYP